jgi:hypothetical protein
MAIGSSGMGNDAKNIKAIVEFAGIVILLAFPIQCASL